MPKRASIAKDAPTSKFPKRDPSFAGVEEAVRKAALDPNTTQMLLKAMPHSLGVLKDQRCEAQVKVVEMIEEVVLIVKQKLQDALDHASSKLTDLKASNAGLDSELQVANDALAGAVAETQAKASVLAEALAVANRAHEASVEKTRSREAAEAELATAQVAKEKFVAEGKAHFEALFECSFGEEGPVEHQKALMELLEQTQIIDSCVSAIPTAVVKPAAERSALDVMIFSEIEKAIEGKTVELTEAVASAAAKAEAAAAEAKEAEAEVETTSSKKQSAKTEVDEATSCEKEARAKASAALHDRDNAEPNLNAATKERDECADQLEQFVLYNIGCLELLRDRETVPAKDAAIATEEAATAKEVLAEPSA